MRIMQSIRLYLLFVTAVALLPACGLQQTKNKIHLVLAVGVDELIRNRCSNPDDSMVNEAIAFASRVDTLSRKSFLVLFGEAFQQKYPGVRLAPLFAGKSGGKIDINADNATVMRSLSTEEGIAISHIVRTLKDRLKTLEIKNSSVNMNLQKEVIDVDFECTGSPEKICASLTARGELGFYEAFENEQIFKNLSNLNDSLAAPYKKEQMEQFPPRDTTSDTGRLILPDHSDATAASIQLRSVKSNPLFALLNPYIQPDNGKPVQGAIVGMMLKRDMAVVNKLFTSKMAHSVMPERFRMVWGDYSGEKDTIILAYAIKIPEDGKGVINNDHITYAVCEKDELNGKYCIRMGMNTAGTEKWAKMTEKCTNHYIAVTVDNVVYSCPRVLSTIAGGKTQISGEYTKESAQALAAILQNGRLDLPARIVEISLVK